MSAADGGNAGFEALFRSKKPDPDKLLRYGFCRDGGEYTYETGIAGGRFVLTVRVSTSESGAVDAEIRDANTGEAYVLHRVNAATGAFVGQVRNERDEVLRAVADACFDPDVFKSASARRAIDHVRAAFGAEPEYLWQKFPGNAVWRRADNRKWFGALLRVAASKLGIGGDEQVEILDLRAAPEALAALVDGKRFFPGYHMNKRHWYTLLLDGSTPEGELFERIGESYDLAQK